MKKDQSTTPTSISFPVWLLEMVDSYSRKRRTTRTAMVCEGAIKQVVLQKRKSDILRVYENREPGDIDITPQELTIKVPAFMKEMVEKHCFDFGADRDDIWVVSVLKYLICKESRRKDIDFLFNEAVNGSGDDFDGIIA